MDLALLPQGYDAVVRKVMHALFGGISRSVAILIAVAVVIVAAPATASWDDRGLPGSPMVFPALAAVAAASGFAFFFTMTPRGARSRALRQLGRDLDLPYSRLLEREPDVSFELDGPWAMTVSHGTDAADPGDLVATLDDVLEHLPPVVIAELGRGY